MVLFQNCVRQSCSRHSAIALLLKAALIQVSDYGLLGVSGLSILNMFQVVFNHKQSLRIKKRPYSIRGVSSSRSACGLLTDCNNMAWSFSIASLDWLIALWLVLMGRSLSLNRTIFKLYRDIYSQVV